MLEQKQKKTKIAFLLTHPIQYLSPLFSRIASEPDIDIVVFYQNDCSLRKHYDKGFCNTIDWDIPLLEGYPYQFLPAIGRRDALGYIKPFSTGLGRRLVSGKFDVIIIHGYNRPYHWLAMVQSWMLGLRVFIRDEATLISKNRGLIKKLLKRGFFAMLNQIVAGYLSIGTANQEYYISNGVSRDRIFMTPYAVDNEFFSKRAKEASKNTDALRSQLKLKQGRPIILYASKLQARKRALDLFNAYCQASKSMNPPPYLLYVGDGELKPNLLERIDELEDDSVRFLGFRNQSELPALYALCDVFVLTSVFEPWGLVVNEAMNAGKAIIVSDQVGSGPDLVKNGENGYIFPAGDVEALADCLKKVLANPSDCKRMEQRSAEIISK